jgi:disulfide bond formation protein DsbB
MNKTTAHLVSLLIAAALLLAACGGGGSAEPQGDAAAGKIAYESTCIACHGVDAKGMPNLGKDLTISQFVKDKTNAEMVEFLKAGRPAGDPLNTVGVDMPPRGGNPALTDEDLLNIVAYVRQLQGQ